MTDDWRDQALVELITELDSGPHYVEFTDEWRALSAQEQITVARGWLRRALGLDVAADPWPCCGFVGGCGGPCEHFPGWELTT